MEKDQAKRIGVQLTNETLKEAKSLVINIHNRLVDETPVDTGWAESNWLLSVGTSVTEPVGSKENIDLAAQKAGIGSILQWSFEKGPAYDTNNVPYIQVLNEGSSTKAPRMFIETAVETEVAKSNRKRLE